jgi:hypothetical protein
MWLLKRDKRDNAMKLSETIQRLIEACRSFAHRHELAQSGFSVSIQTQLTALADKIKPGPVNHVVFDNTLEKLMPIYMTHKANVQADARLIDAFKTFFALQFACLSKETTLNATGLRSLIEKLRNNLMILKTADVITEPTALIETLNHLSERIYVFPNDVVMHLPYYTRMMKRALAKAKTDNIVLSMLLDHTIAALDHIAQEAQDIAKERTPSPLFDIRPRKRPQAYQDLVDPNPERRPVPLQQLKRDITNLLKKAIANADKAGSTFDFETHKAKSGYTLFLDGAPNNALFTAAIRHAEGSALKQAYYQLQRCCLPLKEEAKKAPLTISLASLEPSSVNVSIEDKSQPTVIAPPEELLRLFKGGIATFFCERTAKALSDDADISPIPLDQAVNAALDQLITDPHCRSFFNLRYFDDYATTVRDEFQSYLLKNRVIVFGHSPTSQSAGAADQCRKTAIDFDPETNQLRIVVESVFHHHDDQKQRFQNVVLSSFKIQFDEKTMAFTATPSHSVKLADPKLLSLFVTSDTQQKIKDATTTTTLLSILGEETTGHIVVAADLGSDGEQSVDSGDSRSEASTTSPPSDEGTSPKQSPQAHQEAPPIAVQALSL